MSGLDESRILLPTMRWLRWAVILSLVGTGLAVLAPRRAESLQPCRNYSLFMVEELRLELVEVRVDGQTVPVPAGARRDAGYLLANDLDDVVMAKLYDPDAPYYVRGGEVLWCPP